MGLKHLTDYTEHCVPLEVSPISLDCGQPPLAVHPPAVTALVISSLPRLSIPPHSVGRSAPTPDDPLLSTVQEAFHGDVSEASQDGFVPVWDRIHGVEMKSTLRSSGRPTGACKSIFRTNSRKAGCVGRSHGID